MTDRIDTPYAVCIDPADYAVSLQMNKTYRVLPDTEAAKHGWVRVIDETGEDYLYPAAYFKPANAPRGHNEH